MTVSLTRAVAAELAKLFLADAVGGDTFPARASIDADDIRLAPVRAEILPSAGETYTHIVGVGYILSEDPRPLAMGGPLSIRNYTLSVTVTVRALADPAETYLPYEAVVMASEFLASLAGKAGTIGGHEDPADSSSPEYTADVMEIEDLGESSQTLDDNGDYEMSRNFILTIA